MPSFRECVAIVSVTLRNGCRETILMRKRFTYVKLGFRSKGMFEYGGLKIQKTDPVAGAPDRYF